MKLPFLSPYMHNNKHRSPGVELGTEVVGEEPDGASLCPQRRTEGEGQARVVHVQVHRLRPVSQPRSLALS
jgi:hypothetical protein